MERILKSTVVLLIAAFFAVMWGAYLRENLFAVHAGSGAGYGELLEPGLESRSLTWGVYLGEARVGRCSTVIKREGDATSIETTTHFSEQITRVVQFLTPVEGELDVVFRAEVAPLTGLRSFRLQVEAMDVDLRGAVTNDELNLTGHAGEKRFRETLPYERGGVVSSAASPIAVAGGLTERSLDQTWTVTMVMPLTSEVRNVDVTPVERRMAIVSTDTDAEAEPVFRLVFRMGASSWMAWVRADGEGLVQTLPPPLPVLLRREDLNTEAIQDLPIGMPVSPTDQ